MANSDLNLPPSMGANSTWLDTVPGEKQFGSAFKPLPPAPTQAQAPALARLASAVARVGGRSPGSLNLFIP